jgi:homoserine kinase
MTQLVRARVRVPCSTSNLGAGFDTIGLALDRYVEADFKPGGHSLEVERTGTLESLPDGPDDDYLVAVFRELLGRADVAPGGKLHIHSQIPVARGLGSSAAARVAGHDLARAALGQPVNQESAFRFACAREAHGDNAAPCALGGLRAVVPGPEGLRPLLLPISEDIGFAYAAPAAGVSTAAARAALPRRVAHEVAVAQLGRLAALIRGLADGDPALIRIGIQDELHVPHRLPLIPGAYNAIAAGYEAGAWAVTISGSGSGLIALCTLDAADPVAAAMREVFDSGANDPDCVGFALHPDFEGLARPDV